MSSPFYWRQLAIPLLAALSLLGRGGAAENDPVDFHRQVWPLLQERCIQCHGPNKVKGRLRLDSRQGAETGGLLGQNLLREPPATNELVRRITTSDPSERMPLEGRALSAGEVEILTRWIQQGATWPEQVSGEVKRRYIEPSRPWLDRWLPLAMDTRPALYAGLLVMIAFLVTERARAKTAHRKTAESSWLNRSLARVPRWTAAVGVLVAIIWGQSLVLASRQRDLDKLRQALAKPQMPGTLVDNESPQIVVKHPPRLGGEYYRGNDERSPHLFNGGFYRTATFGLHLVDGDGQVLQWNDDYLAEPRIRLTIERAPQATARLFTDKIMSGVFLTAVHPKELPQIEHVHYRMLETVSAGEKWKVDYGLPACSSSDRLNGELFLCMDMAVDNNRLVGSAHYQIDYDLHIQGGKIEPQSRLSLVAVYQAGNVAMPKRGQISPDEWFDFRPIPIIEGEPSTDPALLGTAEHLEKSGDAGEP